MVNKQMDSPRGDILIVDDDLPSLNTLSSMLTNQGYEVRGVPDGPMALAVIDSKPPELILLDVRMAEMDGFEVCRQIKANEEASGIPVLFLSALDATAEKVKGFAAGGLDFITKPFQAEEVLARVDSHIKLSRLSRNFELFVEKRTAELTESEKALTEQIAFERLIAELAGRLAQVLPENIDAEIQEILSSLGQFLQSERAFVFQFTADGKSLKNAHVWASEGFSPQSEIFELDLASDVPWVARQIRSGGVIIVGPGFAGLPDEARELQRQLERDGINSGFVVPIIVEGRSIGMIGLDTVDKAREYQALLMERMRVLADMIGSTLARVRVQRKLKQYKHIVESTTSIVGLVDQQYVYQYVIFVNENLMYCRCNFCKSAFKFKRRVLSHYRDSCGWEYIIKDSEGDYFGVRGYSIRIETFENISNQYHAIKTYFRSDFCEIDDVFKEMTNDYEENIFKSLSQVFSDEKYYKNEKVIQNWHCNENFDANDDDLLRELENM